MLWVYTTGFVNYGLGTRRPFPVVLMGLLVVVTSGNSWCYTRQASGGVSPWLRWLGRAHAKNRLAGAFSYYVVAPAVALIFLFPLVWAAIRSLQGVAAEGSPPIWASLVHLTLTNYTSVLTAGGATLWRFAGDSAVVAGGTVAISVFVSVLAGYGLARLRFRGAGLVFVFLLTPFIVPYRAVIHPFSKF